MQPLASGRLRLMSKWYVLLFAAIALLVAATVVYNTVADLWGAQLMSDAEAVAQTVEAEIKDSVDIFNFCFDFFTMYAEELSDGTDNEDILKAFDSIFGDSALKAAASRAYFYHLNYTGLSGYAMSRGEAMKLNTISQYEYPKNREPSWQLAFNKLTEKYSIIYLRPYIQNGEYKGYIGLELDSDYLASKLPNSGGKPPVSVSLLSSDGRAIIHDNIESGTRIDRSQRYSEHTGELLGAGGVERLATLDGVFAAVHVPLATGHILIYETPQTDIVSQNLMLIFFFLMSVVCVVPLFSKDENGTLLLEVICDKILGVSGTDPSTAARARASLMLHMSVTVMLLYRLVCNIFMGSSPIEIGVLAFIVFGMLCAAVSFKFYIKYIWISALATVVAPLLVPALLALTGESTAMLSFTECIWSLVGVIGPIFIYKKRVFKLIFPIFSVMLFVSIFLLAIFSNSAINHDTYIYFSNIFFAGFALFTAVMVFTSRTDSNYTELRDTLDMLREAQSSLVQHEKMVTLGKLIAGVAHEINTPIGAIKASAETLDSSFEQMLSEIFFAGGILNEKAFAQYTRLLRIASESIREMRATSEVRRSRAQMRAYLEDINLPNRADVQPLLERMEICDIEKVESNLDLFTFEDIVPVMELAIRTLPMLSSVQTTLLATAKVSKIVFALKTYAHSNPSGERSFTNLPATIETVLMLYHNQIKQSVKIVQNYDEDLPQIMANADELSQVWTNLVQNALHAMQYSGTLTISAKRQDENIAVSVADTGTGIDPQLCERIFEPFYTTKPLGEGSGLGLDICRRIINDHNGKITVESTPGKGTVFTVILPTGG